MNRKTGKVHVVRIKKTGYVDKQGRCRDYSSAYLRRTYREAGQVKNETLANLSALPDHVIDLVDAGLKGQQLVPAGEAVTITRSLPHGHVAAVRAMAATLELPALLGPASPQRDLALALVISRVVAPASQLSAGTWWADTTLGGDLGVAAADTPDGVYAAMDWLEDRQDAIEAQLAARHLALAANPARLALFDLSSSRLEGAPCPPAARRCSRDGQKGRQQIEYGLLTDPVGRPVAVRVLSEDTGDPAAFTQIAQVVRDKFGPAQMVMVGNPGMITSTGITAQNQREDETARPDACGWITALHAPAVRKLMADDLPLHLSLFDTPGLAEITSEDFPGERLIACRDPVLAADRARQREDLLHATEQLLAPFLALVAAGQLTGAGPIAVGARKVFSRYKTSRHFHVTITGNSLAVTRKHDQIDADAALDGLYILRTRIPPGELDTPGVVAAYQNLKYLERDLRHIQSGRLDPQPVFRRLDERVRAHVLICMLACYLVWHLRRAWAPLTHPAHGNPVVSAQPYLSFRGLIEHLATLTRNQVRFAGTSITVPMLTEPTSIQRQAFSLLGTAIPLTLSSHRPPNQP
jgi:hypothetical protein